MIAIYQSPFLIALGWTIAASIWQSALLWIVYQVICNIHRKIAPSLKHFTAAVLLLGSFGWFIATLANTYNDILRINGSSSGPQEDSGTAMVLSPPIDTFFSRRITDFANQYLPYISAAYLIVLLLLLTKLVKAYWHSRQLKTKGLVKPVDHWVKLAARYAQKIGITKKVHIYLSLHISVPATLNFFKPVILLPLATLNHLSVQQVESIILHELAHIKRNDYLINIIASVIETILFFNPFVHLLGRSLKKEREHCCDDMVLQHRFDPHSYASALLSLEQMRVGLQPMAIAATGNSRQLLVRIKRIMNINTAPFNYGQRLLALVLMTFVMTSVAWLSPQAGNTKRTLPDRTYNNNTNSVNPLIAGVMAVLPDHKTSPQVAPEKKMKIPLEKELSRSRKNSKTNTPASQGMVPLPPFTRGGIPLNDVPPLPPSPTQPLFNDDAEISSPPDIFTGPIPPTAFFDGHYFSFRHDLPDTGTKDGVSWWKHAEEDMAIANAGAINDLIKQIDATTLKTILLNSQYSQLLAQEQLKLSLFNSLAEQFSSAGKMFSEGERRLDSLKKVSVERAEKQKEDWLKKARKRNGQGTNEVPVIYKFIVQVDNTIHIHPDKAKSLKKNIPVTVFTKKSGEEKGTMKETFSYGNVSIITASEDKKAEEAAYTHRGMNTERKRIVISL